MLELRGMSKRYGGRPVVDDVSLELAPARFLSLLGPSGSGKSTLLRTIAGLVRPDAGTIRIGGDLVCGARRDVPPERRAIGMVFQDYALWPHMTVAQNIAFGLRLKGWPRRRTAARIGEMLELVRLTGLEQRYPHQLSGGQQQRVALARSLATHPRLLLLDEPLASLDTQLRQVLRTELAAILREIGVTSVYVTHDQSEALEMSDIIAVLRDGRVEQMGTPTELYERPSSLFVEAFMGSTNMLRGRIERQDGVTAIRVGESVLFGRPAAHLDGDGVLCIRPEVVQVASGATPVATNLVLGTLLHSGFAGGRWQHLCTLPGNSQVRLFTVAPLDMPVGSPLLLHLPPDRCRILAPDAALER